MAVSLLIPTYMPLRVSVYPLLLPDFVFKRGFVFGVLSLCKLLSRSKPMPIIDTCSGFSSGLQFLALARHWISLTANTGIIFVDTNFSPSPIVRVVLSQEPIIIRPELLYVILPGLADKLFAFGIAEDEITKPVEPVSTTTSRSAPSGNETNNFGAVSSPFKLSLFINFKYTESLFSEKIGLLISASDTAA